MNDLPQKLALEQLRMIAELMWQRIRAKADYELGVSKEKPPEPMGVAQKAADNLYQGMGVATAYLSIQDLFLYVARTQEIIMDGRSQKCELEVMVQSGS